MFASRVLDEIQTLDPVTDHCRIVYLSTCFDFPFDTARALEFALFRTYAVPSISGLLDRTGEFGNRAQKRYDDTDLILSEMVGYGYDSVRGKAALKRMNQIHSRFHIANEDYLYVLSTFVFEPIRWNRKYGWRPMVEKERQGLFHFWREIGRRMAIRDIPPTFRAFEDYNLGYEREHFRYTESNRRVGEATRGLFLSWIPAVFRPLGLLAIHAMMDDPLRDAFGFPQAPGWVRTLSSTAMELRRRSLPLFPRRRKPFLRTEIKRPLYPDGYRIEELGPPPAGERGPMFDG